MYQQGGHNTDNIKPNERPRHCIVEQRAHLSGRVPKPQLANCTPEGAFKLNNRRVTSILVLGGMDPLQDDQNLSKQINQCKI